MKIVKENTTVKAFHLQQCALNDTGKLVLFPAYAQSETLWEENHSSENVTSVWNYFHVVLSFFVTFMQRNVYFNEFKY